MVFLIFTKLDSTYLFCWLIGSIAYLIKRNSLSRMAIVTGVALTLFGIASVQLGTKSDSVNLQWGVIPSLSASRIFLAAGIAMIVQQIILLRPERVWAVRAEAVGTYLAGFSYTLYLTHYPVLKLLIFCGVVRSSNLNVQSIAIYMGIVLICFAAAWLFYLPFERNTAKCRKWINTKFENSSYTLNTSR